jgi:hypothetical protein
MRVEGMVGETEGYLGMFKPSYHLLPRETTTRKRDPVDGPQSRVRQSLVDGSALPAGPVGGLIEDPESVETLDESDQRGSRVLALARV